MENNKIEDLLFNHFAGKLTGVEENELLDWLQADPSHKNTYSEMADWWATAHVPLFASERKANFEEHFGHLFVANRKKLSPVGRKRILWRQTVAAVVALLIVGGFSFYAGKLSHRILGGEESVEITFSEVTVPFGSTSKVSLPDGSTAWVNAGSTLKYDADFNQSIREVSLVGEAYFEVRPDSLKPFIVKSESMDIQVLGTTFNVKAYTEDSHVDVALLSGSVKVNVHTSGFEADDIRLTPNKMLSFDKESNSMNMADIRGKDAIAWVSGKLIFSEISFPRIARDLERKFNVQIRIDSERLRKDVFTGSFSSTHTLRQILREVDVEKKFKWTQTENEIIISDR